ncbi:hypothetical protein V6N13_137951 [Hibiscus sabdariffa]
MISLFTENIKSRLHSGGSTCACACRKWSQKFPIGASHSAISTKNQPIGLSGLGSTSVPSAPSEEVPVSATRSMGSPEVGTAGSDISDSI